MCSTLACTQWKVEQWHRLGLRDVLPPSIPADLQQDDNIKVIEISNEDGAADDIYSSNATA